MIDTNSKINKIDVYAVLNLRIIVVFHVKVI
jgi:hypothetical protein